MGKAIKKEKLREEPIHLDDHNWYYEERSGICLVHEVMDTRGNFQKTEQIRIPWKKVLESVKRKYGI